MDETNTLFRGSLHSVLELERRGEDYRSHFSLPGQGQSGKPVIFSTRHQGKD